MKNEGHVQCLPFKQRRDFAGSRPAKMREVYEEMKCADCGVFCYVRSKGKLIDPKFCPFCGVKT